MMMRYVSTECKHADSDHLMCQVVRLEYDLQPNKDTCKNRNK